MIQSDCKLHVHCGRRAQYHTGYCEPHHKRWLKGKRGEALAAPLRVMRRFTAEKALAEGAEEQVQDVVPAQVVPVKSYDARFAEWMGIVRARRAPIKKLHGDSERFLLISDLHIPFHNERAILDAIETGVKLKCKTVVVGGDALDCYSLSRFTHFKSVPIRDEFTEARKIFDLLSREFPNVVVLTGNHEERERKHFLKKLTPDEAQWLLEKCILQRVTEDMPNVQLVRERFYETDILWFTMIGDCLIGHPEKSSSVPANPPLKFKQWIDDWHVALNKPRPRVIFMGHTHQFSAAWIGNTYTSEIGCLCKIQEYALGPTLYGRPQRLGYVTFEQVKGITQIESIKHWFPYADEVPQIGSPSH